MADLDALFTMNYEPEKFGFTAQSQESDTILLNFLQEMIELDRQPAAETVVESPKRSKRPVDEEARPPKKPRADKLPTERWQRRKLELQKLKDEAEALQNYVEFLKTRRVPGAQSSVKLSLQVEQYLQSRGSWQATAVREDRCCQMAQQENTHLKEQLEAYTQISGALRTVFNAASTLRKDQLARNSIASRALQVEMMLDRQHVWENDSAVIFDMLEESVNARVGELQAIAEEMSRPVLAVNTEDIQICRKDASHPVVEFRTQRVLPFDADTVARVCWGVAQLGCIASRSGARVIKRSEDVFSTDTCLPIPLENGETLKIRVRCVVKRFSVQGNFVVIAESLTDWPAYLADSGVWSRTTREAGWGLVYPYRSTAKESTPACASRFLMSMASAPSTSVVNHKLLNSSAMNDVVIPSFRTLIRSKQQNVDNHLMDASFAIRAQTV